MMTAADVSRVLAKAAAFDQRTIGRTDVLAWIEAIGDLDIDDALTAVTRHYRETNTRLMPADLRRIVAELGRERRRSEREAREADGKRALEATPRSDRSMELLAAARALLPPGDPDKLRWGHRHWRELQERRRRRSATTSEDAHA
jgi:hypothetical protein